MGTCWTIFIIPSNSASARYTPSLRKPLTNTPSLKIWVFIFKREKDTRLNEIVSLDPTWKASGFPLLLDKAETYEVFSMLLMACNVEVLLEHLFGVYSFLWDQTEASALEILHKNSQSMTQSVEMIATLVTRMFCPSWGQTFVRPGNVRRANVWSPGTLLYSQS